MPHLSKAQVSVLAMYSFAMVLTKSCGLTTVSSFVAALLGQKENTVRQRLREWCYDPADKRGKQRQGLEVATCFAPLLSWVLSWWEKGEHRLALAMDASTLGQRFTVLAVSVVYRGCAIPVAWVVVRATDKGHWKPHWESLLACLSPAVPSEWLVIVLADRGLYAKWLYQAVAKQGWHPFLRINKGGTFRPSGERRFRPLACAAPATGSAWSGAVDCFVTGKARLSCTLLARWESEHAEPWLILTDLPPELACTAWYAMRAWIEAAFKDTKRGGWHWHQTKMTDPHRASRLWLIMAVASLWVLSVGGAAEALLPPSSLDALPLLHIAHRRPQPRSRPRLLSCFARGINAILVALLDSRPFPTGRFVPFPWPT